MKTIITIVICCITATLSFSQTGIAVPSMATCDNLVTTFMANHNIPGATFALAKDGKLVYMRAFGHADIAGQELTQPHHLFRVASISKPITAIAIMKMVENGQLNLSDKVFGTGGVLENHTWLSTATINDSQIYNITVQHLLEHSAGWNRDLNCTPNPTPPYPYHFSHCDPIAFPLHVTQTNGTTNPVQEEDMIEFLLEKGLDFAPGTSYNYSNIGYLILGEIIEEVSGLTYEDYVKNTILAPLGICDMHLAKNLLADKQEREGEYIGNGFTNLSCYNTGQQVPWEYGGFSVEAMSAHGGWIATARDLVRLLVAVDNFSTKPDILSTASINTMIAPSANNANYGKGWAVNSANYWHTGALDGTASFFCRTNGGYTWAIILNKRNINNYNFWSDLDNLPWSCLSSTTSYPSHDLLDVPSISSSALNFSNIYADAMTISWTKGNGHKRLLIATTNNNTAYPLDGITYNASTTFGNGDVLGNNAYVVYNGTGNSVTITGLTGLTDYSFKLFEYNQSTNTGNYPLYALCDAATAMQMTTDINSSTHAELLEKAITLFPNLTADHVQLKVDYPFKNATFQLLDTSGKIFRQGKIQQVTTTFHLTDLAQGLYIIRIEIDGMIVLKKVIKM